MKRTKFNQLRKSMMDAGISPDSNESLVCPLCWQVTPYGSLSLEHVVSSSVGGKQTPLTCRRCNNVHGYDLDSHLAQYQRIADAFRGHGSLKTELDVNGHKMAANLKWLKAL